MMAKSCCSSSSSAEATREDLDRWTDNVFKTLESPRARRKFHEFLAGRKMKDAERTVRFWEKCDALLIEMKRNNHLKHAESLRSDIAAHKQFRGNFEQMVHFAVEHVNFDAGQLRALRQTAASSDLRQIKKVIEQAQYSAANELYNQYDLFRDVLLKGKIPKKIKK